MTVTGQSKNYHFKPMWVCLDHKTKLNHALSMVKNLDALINEMVSLEYDEKTLISGTSCTGLNNRKLDIFFKEKSK